MVQQFNGLAVGRVFAAIDFRYLGSVNTAKTHRYYIRFVGDIFGALRRSIRYHFWSNLSWPQHSIYHFKRPEESLHPFVV
jgi:hypothetical protein